MNSTKPPGTSEIADRRREGYSKAEASILGKGHREWRGLRAVCARSILPLLLLLILPTLVQAQFEYTVENGAVTITKYTGPGGDLTIPNTIDGLPVTSIGYYAFYGCTDLTSVTIPGSVTSIGSRAFYGCTGLSNVTIPGNVSSIGEFAFQNCTGLTSVTIPDGVTSIEQGTFMGCANLISVTIPDSVITIKGGTFLANPAGAFSGCSSLTTIELPNSLTDIGPFAFIRCTGLTSVVIGNSVTSIGGGAFSDCSGLTSVMIGKGVTSMVGGFSYCISLTRVYFGGPPPLLFGTEFYEADSATVYYLPGSTGWGTTFAGRPTALWIPITPTLSPLTAHNPLKLVTHSPAPATVRVQRSTNLVDWEDWQTVSRDAGPSELQDSEAGTASWRFYRGIEE